MTSRISFSLLAVLLFASVGFAQDLAGIKCVINGKAQASPDASVEYLDGKVYFCCENCVAKFQEGMEKQTGEYFVKANHQLVLTGQYVQKSCPISGHPVADGQVVKVGGAEVGLCCANCVAKVNDAEGLPAKAEIVFSRKAFEKGFELAQAAPKLDGVKCLLMPKKDVVAEHCVDYEGGKVYFCCPGCKTKFSKSPESYVAQANHQLVATGQVKQLSCPISGGDFDEEISTEVGGVAVNVCCKNCLGQIERANDTKKVELVFGAKGFKRGYQKEEKTKADE